MDPIHNNLIFQYNVARDVCDKLLDNGYNNIGEIYLSSDSYRFDFDMNQDFFFVSCVSGVYEAHTLSVLFFDNSNITLCAHTTIDVPIYIYSDGSSGRFSQHNVDNLISYLIDKFPPPPLIKG